MAEAVPPSLETAAPRSGARTPSWVLQPAWARYGGAVLTLAAAHALITAVLRLTGATESLAVLPDGPIDLLIRMDEVRRWFAGVTIYSDPDSANYPPATYTLLWPLIGWLPERPTRVLFALSMLASVLVTAVVAVRASGALSIPAKAFMALFVLPLGATQITVWIGQLGLHVVASLLGAAALLFATDPDGRGEAARTPARALAAAVLLAASLVKPTLSVPVVAVILVLDGRWQLTLLTAGVYLSATLIAAGAQEHSALELAFMWLGRESVMNLPLGSVNTHLWLHWLGVEGTMLPASLLWLAAVVLWAWRYRQRVDPWVGVGIGALVGRLWIHHRAFDDVLLVIPAIALLRVAMTGSTRPGLLPTFAAVLLAAIYGLGHAPYSYLDGRSPTLWLITELGRTVAWVAALVFLVRVAHREVEPSPAP